MLAHAMWFVLVPRIGFVTDDFLWLEDAARERPWMEHALSRQPFGYLRPTFHLLVAGSLRVFGMQPLPLHALALVTSVVAGVLLWRLLSILTEDRRAAALGALFFVWHPAHTATLSWISCLPTLLATAGVIGAALAWCAFRRTAALVWGVTSVVAAAFALGSKEEAVVLAAWLAALEGIGKGKWLPWSSNVRRFALAHFLLIAVYLAVWAAASAAAAPSTPENVAAWSVAVLDPTLRLPSLWIDRKIFGSTGAAVICVVVFVSVLRRTRSRGAVLAAVALAYAALLPSSMFLARYPYDQLGRLLAPAVPAAAVFVAMAVARLRQPPALAATTRWIWTGVVIVTLMLFALRSTKAMLRRAEDGRVAAQLLMALQQHASPLRRLALHGEPVRLRGYPADWIYPAGPAAALAPGLRVLVEDEGPEVSVSTLTWDPVAARFLASW